MSSYQDLGFLFTIPLRQKPKGVMRSRRRTCLSLNEDDIYSNPYLMLLRKEISLNMKLKIPY